MTFKKGHATWNKGLTKETDERVRNTAEHRIGQKRSKECKLKMSLAKKDKYNGKDNPFYGKHHTQKTKDIVSRTHKNKTMSEDMRRRISISSMGRKNTEISKERVSQSHKKLWRNKEWREEHLKFIPRGENHYNYKDGRSKLLPPTRYGDDWEKIRYVVYLRDNFTCQDCGIKNIILDIHHKVSFLISHDNSLSNLITLCKSCHMKEERRMDKIEVLKWYTH